VFENAPWGVGEAVIIFIIAYIAASIVSLGIYAVLKSRYSTSTTAFLLIFFSSVVLYTFLLGGTFYSVIVRHKSNVQALGLRFAGSGKAIAWGFALGVPLFVAAIAVAWISEKIFGPTNTDVISQSVTKLSSVSPGLIALLVITLVLLAPVCEEIFFRGYLYPALQDEQDPGDGLERGSLRRGPLRADRVSPPLPAGLGPLLDLRAQPDADGLDHRARPLQRPDSVAFRRPGAVIRPNSIDSPCARKYI
jgi:membrane protease YdiL (CAAX protease family)